MADTKLTFANPDTAAKFEALVSKDRTITIPGKFSGKLSKVPPDVAQLMVDMQDNQLKVKGAAPKPLPGPGGPTGDPK